MEEDIKKEKENVGEKGVTDPKGGANEHEECKKKRDEYLAGWQRAKADFINYKREELTRLEEIARYGSEDLMRDLIGVLDSFELGIAALEREGPVERGVYMIHSQIIDILAKKGLEPIKVNEGEKFDPSVHEAIAEVKSDKPPGTIVERIEAGCKLHDKILRPARVKVSKGDK